MISFSTSDDVQPIDPTRTDDTERDDDLEQLQTRSRVLEAAYRTDPSDPAALRAWVRVEQKIRRVEESRARLANASGGAVDPAAALDARFRSVGLAAPKSSGVPLDRIDWDTPASQMTEGEAQAQLDLAGQAILLQSGGNPSMMGHVDPRLVARVVELRSRLVELRAPRAPGSPIRAADLHAPKPASPAIPSSLGVVPTDMKTPVAQMARAQIVDNIRGLTPLVVGPRVPDAAIAARLYELYRRLAYIEMRPHEQLRADEREESTRLRAGLVAMGDRTCRGDEPLPQLRARYVAMRQKLEAQGSLPPPIADGEKYGIPLAEYDRRMAMWIDIIRANDPLSSLAFLRSMMTGETLDQAHQRVAGASAGFGAIGALAMARGEPMPRKDATTQRQIVTIGPHAAQRSAPVTGVATAGISAAGATAPRLRTTPMIAVFAGENVPGNRVWSHGRVVTYLSPTERARYKLEMKDGVIYDAQGNRFDTANATSIHGGRSKAIFVMDVDGNIYASTFQGAGRFHHSSLMGGAPIAAAGEIVVDNGRLVMINNASGHYLPGPELTDQALNVMRRHGVNVDIVERQDVRPGGGK